MNDWFLCNTQDYSRLEYSCSKSYLIWRDKLDHPMFYTKPYNIQTLKQKRSNEQIFFSFSPLPCQLISHLNQRKKFWYMKLWANANLSLEFCFIAFHSPTHFESIVNIDASGTNKLNLILYIKYSLFRQSIR